MGAPMLNRWRQRQQRRRAARWARWLRWDAARHKREFIARHNSDACRFHAGDGGDVQGRQNDMWDVVAYKVASGLATSIEGAAS